ncbi:MAG TPA: DNA mismatch repair protein MutS [Clostridiaceae bacterium]|jgi:DNA mismatch repair protein MutS|nr:DNA mismatch repair protein MutS [Clostridia bacterium]MBP8634324.1 DNA mismatch repair protein MutS [Clostridia bacterium]MED9924942.1 DNA mismatch repair protein MutS [Clostridia bacterium]HJJ18489.1 DNA mismatch repair protein MutS [Clostridiaceae bacterium]
MAEFSPMMQRYLETKEEYKDCILFYRLGDFYEMFFEDAITASRELELTLTGKDCGQEERAPMCGIPHHAAEIYVSRLINKGYKVAICEQLEDPKTTKGIVKRGVIRVVTPGTLVESNMLEERKNNYIMSIYKTGIYFGISICDISTGEFYSAEIKDNNNFPILLDEIARYTPSELVINSMMANCLDEMNKIKERFENVYITKFNDKFFSEELNNINLRFNVVDNNERKIENLAEKKLALSSINALVQYIEDTQKTSLDHINKITIYNLSKYMALDINARRNLEITEKMRDKSKKGTLLWVLDKTSTSMGGRLLRRWLNDPLVDVDEINRRLNAVKELKDDIILRGEVIENLKKVYDIERLAGKMAYGNANARDMVTLKNSLFKLPEVKQILKNCKSDLLKGLYEKLDELQDIYQLIEKSIVEDPPMTIKDGGIIKLGYDEEIDKLKTAQTEGKTWLVQLEAEEKEKTGIKNLKIGFNKVFGYFIEVTKSYLDQVPDRFIRKQTLTNAERYITEDLKNLENQILGAEEKVINLEYNAFVEIREEISKNVTRLQTTSEVISSLDVLTSFAQVAEDFNYCMPVVDSSGTIDIKNGRHPVIEKILGEGVFVENDTFLDKGDNRLSIITGPNMAGKSTYMRQVALITLMAQCGSFVPAESANIGVVDKIFTRVGASDDLSMGQSTFMVEMMEVATILKEATPNSLVILDEIGRGTSTYDGLSIAWAVAEYIADKQKCGAKTLFATHYHELTELENKIEGIKNYSIAVKEKGEDIIFLRKIVRGGTDESYGIHVARLAGVPKVVTQKANEILRSLEKKNILTGKKQDKKQVEGQFDMYNYKLAEIAHEIDKVNLNELTPIDALNTLVRIKEKMK